jgi:putative Mn2+ efflux pump MntP
MEQLKVFLIALGLAMDAFAVSLGASAAGRARGARAALRMSFHFGLFQFMMPVIGWFAGSLVADLIRTWDHWIAFGLLCFVGGRMIAAARGPADAPTGDPSRGWTLLLLAVATSIDALAVGISLAMLPINIWYTSMVIGLVAAAMSLIGIRLGAVLRTSFGRRMELVGGVILILIGVRILVEHL